MCVEVARSLVRLSYVLRLEAVIPSVIFYMREPMELGSPKARTSLPPVVGGKI
jgi:hypothetical protein